MCETVWSRARLTKKALLLVKLKVDKSREKSTVWMRNDYRPERIVFLSVKASFCFFLFCFVSRDGSGEKKAAAAVILNCFLLFL